METLSDFKSLQDSIQQSLVAVTRSANQIASEDLGFHRSLDPSIATLLDKQNARLLGLTQRLLGNAAANTEVVGPQLPDFDSVDGNWKGIVDVVDSLLEKADTSLDEYTGAVKRLSPSGDLTPTNRQRSPSRIAAALRQKDVTKPQLTFQHVPNNVEMGPFKPLLEHKPYATVSFDKSLELQTAPDGLKQYPHPYQTEIEQYEYPSSVYTKADPILYSPFDKTTATFVDTEESMQRMLEELKEAKEIAIDLEHHDLRSYIGLVSLMQISTRDKDWIVDTLRPWRRKLQCLNEVFANPNILKVFHGAHMDMIWLQRDLGLYVVGLFDTHFASRALGYPGGSLAFLLKKFIDFDAQKQYQMADWRIRPLPKEFFDYARSDTHFLLYIYDNMRNELIDKSDFAVPNHEKDKVHDVLVRSKEVALQRYQHPIYDAQRGLGPMGWYRMLSRTPAMFTKQQFSVFRAVHEWRDRIAREQDDSSHYILANHNIFSIAKEMPLQKAALFAVVQPLSQTIRLRADELVAVIVKAKETGEEGPEMWDMLHEIEAYVREIYGEEPHRRSARNAAPPPPAAPAPKPATTDLLAKQPTNQNNSLLRATVSWLFGPTADPSKGQKRHLTTGPAISLSVPLPPLTAEIFADTTTPIKPTATTTTTPTTTAPNGTEDPKDEQSEIFTLKSLNSSSSASRKRKSDVLEPTREDDADLANQADEIGISGPSAAESEKAARKAARKAAKRAKREAVALEENARAAAADDDNDTNRMLPVQEAQEDEEGEFDYATAPSVLNAPRPEEKRGRDRRGKDRNDKKEKDKGKKKEFNPFAKALDTTKGVARAQKERAGKSMTFRS